MKTVGFLSVNIGRFSVKNLIDQSQLTSLRYNWALHIIYCWQWQRNPDRRLKRWQIRHALAVDARLWSARRLHADARLRGDARGRDGGVRKELAAAVVARRTPGACWRIFKAATASSRSTHWKPERACPMQVILTV